MNQKIQTIQDVAAPVSTLSGHYDRIQKILAESRRALTEVLPGESAVERHIRTALTLWRTDEKLQPCDPLSYSGVVMEAAQLHLSLDRNLGQAYIIPRKSKVSGERWVTLATLLVGYPGIVKLARDSGQVIDYTAQLVRANDVFHFALGTEKFLRHSWSLHESRGDIIGGYLYVRLTSGEQHLFLMTAPELEDARRRVLTANGIELERSEDGTERGFKNNRKTGERYEADSPWISDPEPMKVKTLIRRGSKTVPLGDAYTRAVALDEAGDLDSPQHLSEKIGRAHV